MPIYTGSGSALSTTGSTSHLVYMDDVIVQSQNTSNANYSVMKEWTASTSGPFGLKFVARNRPGTYYWSYIVYNATKGTRINPAGNGNDGNNCKWSDYLDTGETSSVHGMRRFSLTCGADINSVTAGDTIQLRMVHTDGSGNPATGTGQVLDCNMLRVYSSTPLLYGGGTNPVIARSSQVLWDYNISSGTTTNKTTQGEHDHPFNSPNADFGGGPGGCLKSGGQHVCSVPGYYEIHTSINHLGKIEVGIKINGTKKANAENEDVSNSNWSHVNCTCIAFLDVGDTVVSYKNLQAAGNGYNGGTWDRFTGKLIRPTFTEYQDDNWISSNGAYYNTNTP